MLGEKKHLAKKYSLSDSGILNPSHSRVLYTTTRPLFTVSNRLAKMKKKRCINNLP